MVGAEGKSNTTVAATTMGGCSSLREHFSLHFHVVVGAFNLLPRPWPPRTLVCIFPTPLVALLLITFFVALMFIMFLVTFILIMYLVATRPPKPGAPSLIMIALFIALFIVSLVTLLIERYLHCVCSGHPNHPFELPSSLCFRLPSWHSCVISIVFVLRCTPEAALAAPYTHVLSATC